SSIPTPTSRAGAGLVAVVGLARVTTSDGAIWRECAGCGVLTALAPEVDRCEGGDQPIRIQRRRGPGWRMPTRAVDVGRPTRYGNPFPAADNSPDGRTEAVRRYRTWLAGQPALIRAVRRELAGRNLACWCPLTAPCHADVLLQLARGEAL